MMYRIWLLVISLFLFQKPYAVQAATTAAASRNREQLTACNSTSNKGEFATARTKYTGDSTEAKNGSGHIEVAIDRKNISKVNIKWTTAFEQNNRGFYVQRKIGSEWKNVAFVFSAADNGYSLAPLAYEYRDENNQKKTSHYRIQQVDMSGFAFYSEVISVEGNKNKQHRISRVDRQ